MTSVITFAPIAAQLARSIALDDLFPRTGVEDLVRAHRNAPASVGPKVPDDVLPFFAHFCVVARAAAQLLAEPAFDGLARFHEEVEEEYMPGGPPQSPVYDSFSMQFVLSAVPQGIGSETPYSVLARLLLRDPSRARLQAMAQSLADSRLDLYRVKEASGNGAEIEPVLASGTVSVRLTGPFLRAGDFCLMRVLPFGDRFFVADSPYLLKASEEDWREYLARVVSKEQSASSAAAPQKASKLSSKEQTRRRQKDKARAKRNEPEEIISRHLKFGASPRHWLDYIMDAYAGERRGIVYLAGVPDRPALLPHSDEYQPEPEPALPPVAAFRKALLETVKKEGLFERALRELQRLGDSRTAGAPALSPNEHTLVAAYATYGLRAADGTTVLARFEHAHRAESLHPEVRSFIDSLNSGWFTALRVDRIHLDQGLEVFDLLREEKLKISERSATRQLALGDLLLGWLCKDPAGTLTLEGGLAHLPAFATAPFMPLMADVRRRMPPLADEQAWKHSAADLPLPLLAGIIALRSNPPLPKLTNTSGDPLAPITGHYRIRARARVDAALAREFLENGDGSYTWVDQKGTSLARFELSPSMLRVRVNSRKRLTAAQQRLEALLGDAIERSLEAHEDLEQAVRTQRERAKKTGPKPKPLELSPELTAEFHQIVLAKLRSTLDESIPQFKGKTLRQLARSAKSRPDAISWLREQERILLGNPQLAGLDLRPLWEELALPFQGLATDAPR